MERAEWKDFSECPQDGALCAVALVSRRGFSFTVAQWKDGQWDARFDGFPAYWCQLPKFKRPLRFD